MANGAPPIPKSWKTQQYILATLFVVLVATSFWIIYRFHQVLLLLFIAIMLGTAFKPAVDWLTRHNFRRVYGEILVFTIVFSLVGGFLWLAVPMLLEQSTSLFSLLENYYREVRAFMVQSPSNLIQRLGFTLPFNFDVETLVPTPPSEMKDLDEAALAAQAAAQVFGYVILLSRGAFAVVAVFLMAFYWTLEGDRAIRSLILFAPAEKREYLREVIEAVQAKVGDFLLGQVVLCFIIGILQLIAYLLIGLPNALVLAILAGIMEAIPVIGPFLGVLPAFLVAASSQPEKIIWVVVSGVLIQMLENNWLAPKVMDRSVGVNPMLTILSFAALSSLFGVIGAVIAIPVAAIFQLFINRTVFERKDEGEITLEGRDHISYLRYQTQEIVQDVRKLVRFKKDGVLDKQADLIEDEIESVANELDRVLSHTAQEDENLV